MSTSDPQKIIIRQKPNEVSAYYGLDQLPIPLAVHPKALQTAYLNTESDGHTWVTGLNENSAEVRAITSDTRRKEKVAWIQKTRARLEKILGVDLGPHSAYWNNFAVDLAKRDSPEQVWDLTIPEMELKLIVAQANRWVAPNLEATNEASYMNCRFYVHDADADRNRAAQLSELKDDVGALLATIRKSREKLFYLCHALELGVNRHMDRQDLYVKLSDYRDRQKTAADLEKLKDLLETDNARLLVRYLVAEGFRRNLSRKEDGEWVFQGRALGNTKENVAEELLIPTNGDLIALLQETIEK